MGVELRVRHMRGPARRCRRPGGDSGAAWHAVTAARARVAGRADTAARVRIAGPSLRTKVGDAEAERMTAKGR